MFSRIERMLNKDEIEILQKLNILLVGIGGVGGYALEMLIRSGIINITIIDSDTIDISNLNRQIISLTKNLGEDKVDVAKKRCLNINPEAKITTKKVFLTKDNIIDTLETNYDYVIDACDTVTTKIELIKFAKLNNIKIISCMGTGNKLDPTKLAIIELAKTTYDPLAKAIRQILAKDGINQKVMTISSTEQARKVNNRTPGSMAIVPSTAGILCASYIINDSLKAKK